jgi:hypothetical protein
LHTHAQKGQRRAAQKERAALNIEGYDADVSALYARIFSPRGQSIDIGFGKQLIQSKITSSPFQLQHAVSYMQGSLFSARLQRLSAMHPCGYGKSGVDQQSTLAMWQPGDHGAVHASIGEAGTDTSHSK